MSPALFHPLTITVSKQTLHRHSQQQGFTLLEILVVLFIMGIILGFATLSIGGRSLDDKLAQEAQRLLQVMQIASDEAALTTAEIGFRPVDGGYVFLVKGSESWVPIENPRSPLRSYSFEIPAEIELTEIPQGMPASTEEKNAPVFFFFSSGELTPFELVLQADGTQERYRYLGRIDGLVSMDRNVSDE